MYFFKNANLHVVGLLSGGADHLGLLLLLGCVLADAEAGDLLSQSLAIP